MNKYCLLVAFAGLSSCQGPASSPDVSGQPIGRGDTVVQPIPAKKQVKQASRWDTLGRGEDYAIFGDSSQPLNKAGLLVELRFKPYVRFIDFQVATTNKRKAAVRYSSNRLAREYRTTIARNYAEKGLNFGGHYCFAYWGCGSSCQASALIDLKTGIIYEGVEAAAGYKFQKDSRLLLVNPHDSTEFYVSGGGVEPKVFVWNEVTKKFEQR